MANNRTDKNLPANIEEDYEILRNKAKKMYAYFKNQITKLEDLFQDLCEIYLEAIQKYHKKPRSFQIRVFVFMYMKFMLMRKYRGQYKFENRYTFPVEKVHSSEEDLIDESSEPYLDRNGYLFDNSYDLNRALAKYDIEDRIIIYYKFYLNKPTKELKYYMPSKQEVTFARVKLLLERLRNDPDLIKLLKEI